MKLITCSDDRSGRKGGLYQATQRKIYDLLYNTDIEQKHYLIEDFIGCDPLMVNVNAALNGRVYKPWCIKQALSEMADGEILIYNDCSPELWPDDIMMNRYDTRVIERLIGLADDFLVGFVKWSDEHIGQEGMGIHTHHNFTLDSCIDIMAGQAYRNSYLCASGMIGIRKTEDTVAIVDRWLYYNRIPECACMNLDETEDTYYYGGPGYKSGNRHDQSVLSMILNQMNWNYCDIAYNDLNPYNFLNFCLPGHVYKFINSNVPEGWSKLNDYG